jgi:hypothetical protein
MAVVRLIFGWAARKASWMLALAKYGCCAVAELEVWQPTQ